MTPRRVRMFRSSAVFALSSSAIVAPWVVRDRLPAVDLESAPRAAAQGTATATTSTLLQVRDLFLPAGTFPS
jgi:hypothetical protein